ncbi:MAG: coenzyme F420-0:L-glutamate ligase [Ornithinimicrobium sp.]|uniref:coenzyme F420-0:L-glutamate ligase n=1 Tax=Ornithinimicrobium sp. TaxID=1977084 RepID=UPI0026DF0B6D|nr:coenzyme F420-0:L-glutamate ligase [Ornithinimicrobium sp.]MDO5739574.1 coenzyme F420-0:L-glutamate ligase [Ornithinimicrobium sp.]
MSPPAPKPLPAGAVTILPLAGLPEITTGADLAALLISELDIVGGLHDGDLLVVSSKVVSKALGLRAPEGTAREDLVHRHTHRIVAERSTPQGTTSIVESVAGPVMAAAGLDASNTGAGGGVLALPSDPDGAARDLHDALASHSPDTAFGLVISDTAGRPWRLGQTDFALGAHGVRVVDDLRGATDADGRPLAVTSRAVADEVAAAADLVKGKTGGVGAALVRGLGGLVTNDTAAGARSLVRTGPADWFALGHREAVRAALGAPPGSAEARHVGIPSVTPEADELRGARAVRLALLGHEDAHVLGGVSGGYAVSSASPLLAGRVAARLEVALAGESVTAKVRIA